MPRPPFLAPFLIIVGAVLLILTAGTEVVGGVRAWLAGNAELPRELILHTLVAGAALLLAAAVLITRRSMQRQMAAEAALRQSEERMRLVANNVPALISYVDRDQRYRFSNRTYDAWFGIPHEEMIGRTVSEVFGEDAYALSLIHISEPTRLLSISYAVFCLKKKILAYQDYFSSLHSALHVIYASRG